MREYRRAFLVWFVLLLLPAYLFVVHMQDAGVWDDLGLWYTVYSAVILDALVAAVLAFFGKAGLWSWGRLRR